MIETSNDSLYFQQAQSKSEVPLFRRRVLYITVLRRTELYVASFEQKKRERERLRIRFRLTQPASHKQPKPEAYKHDVSSIRYGTKSQFTGRHSEARSANLPKTCRMTGGHESRGGKKGANGNKEQAGPQCKMRGRVCLVCVLQLFPPFFSLFFPSPCVVMASPFYASLLYATHGSVNVRKEDCTVLSGVWLSTRARKRKALIYDHSDHTMCDVVRPPVPQYSPYIRTEYSTERTSDVLTCLTNH